MWGGRAAATTLLLVRKEIGLRNRARSVTNAALNPTRITLAYYAQGSRVDGVTHKNNYDCKQIIRLSQIRRCFFCRRAHTLLLGIHREEESIALSCRRVPPVSKK